MSDKLPGSSYDNPIWYGKFRIFLNPDWIDANDHWAFVHDDFDGAPDAKDNRYGAGKSVEECQEQINENHFQFMREAIQHILDIMFRGWGIREKSFDHKTSTYTIEPLDAMIQAAGGDQNLGSIVHLFSHWSNDIQSIAPHFGIACKRNEQGDVIADWNIPVPPSPNHDWHNGQWVAPEEFEVIDQVDACYICGPVCKGHTFMDVDQELRDAIIRKEGLDDAKES